MAIIYIDNNPHEVKDGQNLLHACLSLGFDVPYFCWHPAMHSVGACRQCAVKVFRDEKDRQGRIVMSCMTPAGEGTRLSIDDPEAREFRARSIEWLMTNHPHDCPVCDEGGECHLQDMTVMAGHVYRRYRFLKRTYENQDLGPLVNCEMNRCIQCYRCVRFYRDYARGRDFHVFASHNHVYFGRHQDGVLESEFSGNLVEVCPTGVFTDKTLKRHYARKWDLQTSPSVCVHCGIGCNTIPGERYGSLRRIRNRFNGEVNGYFLCDRGRYGYEFVDSAKRIRQPLYRRHDTEGQIVMEQLNRKDILQRISEFIHPGASDIIGIGSPRASCESNFALLKFVGQERFSSGLAKRDQFLIATIIQILSETPARVASLKDIEGCDAVFIVGEDISNTAPRLALTLYRSVMQKPMAVARHLHIPPWDDAAVREAIQDQRGPLFIATPAATRLDQLAVSTFRAAPDEITRLALAVAHALHKEAPPVPDAAEDVRLQVESIARALLDAEHPLVICGMTMGDEAMVKAAANVATALSASGKKAHLYCVTPECNTTGMGLFGGMSLEEVAAVLEKGSASALIIVENDIYRRVEKELADRIIGAARKIIVMDCLANATTVRADLLLPAASFAEGSGTLVSSEGRAQRFYRVFDATGDIRESWRWLQDIMAASGYPRTTAWQNLDGVTADMVVDVPTLKDLGSAFPGAAFRLAGQKIPRQPHRYSGRTAMTADRNVHEPKPFDDPDSSLAFSMEGFPGASPPTLIPRFWAPGWNSVQAVNKFQSEIGGALMGGDPGVRLFDAPDACVKSYFQVVPPAMEQSHAGQVLLVPVHHIFGSDELSVYSPGVAGLCPEPYLAINPVDGETLRLRDEENTVIIVSGREIRLPVRLDGSFPPGLAGIPVGLPGLLGITLPARGVVISDREEGREV